MAKHCLRVHTLAIRVLQGLGLFSARDVSLLGTIAGVVQQSYQSKWPDPFSQHKVWGIFLLFQIARHDFCDL